MFVIIKITVLGSKFETVPCIGEVILFKGPAKERLKIMEGTKAWVHWISAVQNVKKFRYCGIDPKLEDKLDLIFLGVVATRDQACTPNQGLDPKNII
ncbi:hypothetical protein IEQ34_000833 [Dendrobium chrysotoxum]|uniref:Uncharacterized protein n=1 Tax=Dendrobium chrysotoxum TaxID=161865 RepID=A0AAV7HVD8_DENCH|nr:hypothetical protein IEQ34_000833 [Dendrobium chrysotoxum]